MTTAKKILTLALCLTCLTAGMTGCAYSGYDRLCKR